MSSRRCRKQFPYPLLKALNSPCIVFLEHTGDSWPPEALDELRVVPGVVFAEGGGQYADGTFEVLMCKFETAEQARNFKGLLRAGRTANKLPI